MKKISRLLVAAGLFIMACGFSSATNESVKIVINKTSEGRVFEGLGGLSAGASSRLLIEYPEPFRSQVLDYLFKPNYGASLQHLKVEIGGDVQSTDGCEPSHMHTRTDENYTRGYEWWLMKEAKARNPAIILDCLEWGVPGWIGGGTNFFSQDNADYIVKFLKGAKSVHGLDIAYAGIWNERSYDKAWIKLLRKNLDDNGLKPVQIVGTDGCNDWSVVPEMKKDPDLAKAIQIVGVHYPGFKSTPEARDCGKPLWSSEDGPWNGVWSGALTMARMFNRNYIVGQMTKTILWALETSYYDCLRIPSAGILRANTPWSGAYEIQPAVWVLAHTTQFTQPGWKYLDDGCGLLNDGKSGSYVTLKSPKGRDYSIIIETTEAREPQELVFEVQDLARRPLHVWQTSSKEWFVQRADIRPEKGRFRLTVQPDSLYSLTTTTGQSKGCAVGAPAETLKLSYGDDFEKYESGTTARYLSEQAGIFEVVQKPGGSGKCLKQVVEQKGIEWEKMVEPYTLMGDLKWCNYEVGIDVLLDKGGMARLYGRINEAVGGGNYPTAYWLTVKDSGEWSFCTGQGWNGLVTNFSGKVSFSTSSWHRLRMRCEMRDIKAWVDQTPVVDFTDDACVSGIVGFGCGWHTALFDNLSINQLGGVPPEVTPIRSNLAINKKAMASSSYANDNPQKITDGTRETSWFAGSTNAGEWAEVDLGAPTTFNNVAIHTVWPHRIKGYKLQYWNQTAWQDIGAEAHFANNYERRSFPDVTASKVRVLFTNCPDKCTPGLSEFEVYYSSPNRAGAK